MNRWVCAPQSGDCHQFPPLELAGCTRFAHAKLTTGVGDEELAFGEVEAVNDAVGGLDGIEFGDIAGGFGQDTGGVQGFAGGEGIEGFDVGFEDTDIAVGETWGRAAALLEFFLAGGGAGIDQDVADAELFNEAEGFLAGAGAYGEHADDAADAEDDAEGSEESARLLSAQVGDGLAEVGEKDHRELAGGSACPTFEKRIIGGLRMP